MWNWQSPCNPDSYYHTVYSQKTVIRIWCSNFVTISVTADAIYNHFAKWCRFELAIFPVTFSLCLQGCLLIISLTDERQTRLRMIFGFPLGKTWVESVLMLQEEACKTYVGKCCSRFKMSFQNRARWGDKKKPF